MQDMKLNRQFQTLLLFVRLLLSGILGWRIANSQDFSTVFTNTSLYAFIGSYATLSIINYLLVLFRPTKASIYHIGSLLDWLFCAGLLFLLPNQAAVSVVIGILFILAALNDLKLSSLILLNASYAALATVAGWYFDTLMDASIHNAHLFSFILFLIAYLCHFKTHNQAYLAELKDSLNTTALQKKHLIDALFYLFPYHQRNQIPLSILMIRVEKAAGKTALPELIQLYKSRLRKSDFLIQLDKQHLAILLPDTNSDQSSHVVKALKALKETDPNTQATYVSYAVTSLPLDSEVALDLILQQMMQSLQEAEQQKVDRLVFVSVKQSD